MPVWQTTVITQQRYRWIQNPLLIQFLPQYQMYFQEATLLWTFYSVLSSDHNWVLPISERAHSSFLSGTSHFGISWGNLSNCSLKEKVFNLFPECKCTNVDFKHCYCHEMEWFGAPIFTLSHFSGGYFCVE